MHLLKQGLCRLSDEDILAKARTENRVLLTMDLDFGRLLALSRASAPSVIMFRVLNACAATVNYWLATVMAQFAGDLNAGAVISVCDQTIGVRHLPIGP